MTIPDPSRSKRIRRLLNARRGRIEHFGDGLFADPAWDILLTLYQSHLEQRRISITAVSDAAGVPVPTAIRWIRKLEEVGLAERCADPLDARRAWLSLTPDGEFRFQQFADRYRLFE